MGCLFDAENAYRIESVWKKILNSEVVMKAMNQLFMDLYQFLKCLNEEDFFHEN